MIKHTPNPSQEGNKPWPIPLLRGVRGVFLKSKWALKQELLRSLLDFILYNFFISRVFLLFIMAFMCGA
jgi:hypothetical protein